MRIRNKLITVQLIMTITLALSVMIFSSLMINANSIKDSQIVINRFNNEIQRLKSCLNTVLTKQDTLINIGKDLGKKTKSVNNLLDEIENNPTLNKQRFKEQLSDLKQSWLIIDTKHSYSITSTMQSGFSEMENRFNSWYGSQRALYELEKWYNKGDEQKEKYIEIEDKYKTLKQHHLDFIVSFENFFAKWNKLNRVYNSRLTTELKNILIRSAVLLILVLVLTTMLSFNITSKIPKNLDAVNKSLLRMTKGDFTTNLNIEAGDEFGDLSRSFNNFVEQLWKKLDSMNIIMKDIGHAMGDNIELSKIQNNIINNITNHIVADAAGIMVLENDTLHLSASRGHFPPFYPIGEDLTKDRPKAGRYLVDNPTPLDIPIIKQCLNTKQPIMVKDCEVDPLFPQCKDKKSSLYIKSFLMVPLINSGEVIGLFILIRNNHTTPFSDLDYSNLFSFSDYAALTLDTLNKYTELLEKFEIQKEIGVAADIQTSLTPKKMPKISGLTSAAFTLAAKGVSGDYYDFFRMNKTTVGATVCDVAGKGVPASLVMVMIRTILRLVASPARGAAETLTLLNKSISGKIDIDRYATMGYFKIDLENLKLHFSNAAHHPIQIFRQKNNKFYAIDSPGLPVGIDRDSKFSEKRVSLLPGDIIFMYTDGFPEARNPDGDEYSTNRMLREIRLHCHKDAKQILDSVVEDMQKFTQRAKQHDDQTLLIVKIDEEKK